ncbi:hypothetical protein COU39_01125 [Candidatus Micrarchaeota archaeon CG10_big_fil_rev_8_21_14_0_10_60_32]|nr:MAG: hypothetical protein AUJ16_02440 [Candidatus Micrarchaeota archaeon CG1_02_60_51]PIN96468.1 MAG: hypothetical protein COU39_01125 [Candidatus Micrarchaeota archaeon CG10_big_fil_rev_8_21_14_0_10_60_32]PIO02455.1 MAG: hypothetical protein COT58_00135 [Candidatus Micrarchaeota archaeon CG09_land_8_20_14_0_10_60_16]
MKRSGSSIYRNASDLDAAFARLEADEAVEPANKELVRKFVNTWLAKGYTKSRAVKLVYCLRKLARILAKPFAEASRDDLIALVGKLEDEKLAESTKYDLKVVLKTFYRFLKGGEDEQTPREVAWLKPRMKSKKHKLPEELLTEKEVLEMAQAASNSRDKALVLTLYESGCRIGELLSLRVKNVQFDDYGAVLRVTGKTGDRRVRIISAAPVLAAWLENYDGSKDPEAFLWPPRSNNNHDTYYPAVHASICKTLEKLAAKAGIRKRIYPHLFRHSRATALAGKLTEAQMKEYFGWTQSSGMASVYVHLSGRDVDNALLELQGFGKPIQKQEEQMKVVFCKRCREKNSPSSKYCARCGTPTDDSLVSTSDCKQQNNLMNALLQDPEVKELMTRKAVERGLNDLVL